MSGGYYYQQQRPMPPQRTQNYFWYTERDDILGEGSYGTVYRGISVQAKQLVAVKCGHPGNPPSTQLLERREIDILRQMNHENIVKLFAVEVDNATQRNVIIMELCVGGTLLDFISLPENSYGTEEDEFKLVLKHVTNGRKYLFDHNIVHRDLKPGNIMRCLTEDGSTMYKLADFGNAKQLTNNDEAYNSICGTEEYLHPQIYGKALIDKGREAAFTAETDLWAIGATLFHTATGKVPFRAFNNRMDRATTFNIISRKLPGVISGVQEIHNGAIVYSRNLPETCYLSVCLKALIEPLLGGILETDHSKVWSFEKYFDYVNAMLKMTCVFVFNVQKFELVKLYVVNPNFEELRTTIADQIKVSPENQVLLFEDDILKSFPEKSTVDNPVYLFNMRAAMIELQERQKPPGIPYFENGIVRDDKKVSEAKCRGGYVYSKLINSKKYSIILSENAAKNLHNCVQSKQKIRLKESMKSYLAQLETHKKRLKILMDQNRRINSVISSINNKDLQNEIRMNNINRTDNLDRAEKQIETVQVQLADLLKYLHQTKTCDLPKANTMIEEACRMANQAQVLTKDLRRAHDFIESWWKYPKPTGDKSSHYYDLKKLKASKANTTLAELLAKQQNIVKQMSSIITQKTLRITLKLFQEGCAWQNTKLQAFPEKMAQIANQLDNVEQESFNCIFKIINTLNATIQQQNNPSASTKTKSVKRQESYNTILSSINEATNIQKTDFHDLVDEYSGLVQELQNIMTQRNPNETVV